MNNTLTNIIFGGLEKPDKSIATLFPLRNNLVHSTLLVTIVGVRGLCMVTPDVCKSPGWVSKCMPLC